MNPSGLAGIIDSDDTDNDNPLGIIMDVNGTVKFMPGGSPEDLPGGEDIDPNFDADFSFAAEAPSPKNGINYDNIEPYETVGIAFYVTQNNLEDLRQAIEDKILRVGLKVQGFENGGSEGFIVGDGDDGNPGNPPVPEPGTMMLFGFGLVGLAGLARKLNV